MNPSLISVIIPTFNRAYCLKESICSVLTQRGFELIVVDDGSTDGTDKVLENFSNVRAIHLQKKNINFLRKFKNFDLMKK